MPKKKVWVAGVRSQHLTFGFSKRKSTLLICQLLRSDPIEFGSPVKNIETLISGAIRSVNVFD
jgi:hypothetical protein